MANLVITNTANNPTQLTIKKGAEQWLFRADNNQLQITNVDSTTGGIALGGVDNDASGACSHAEGYDTTASGEASHAEGYMTVAHNVGSHAGGYGTETACDYQTVIGKFNTLDSTKSFIIGGGSQNQTTNIFTVDWEGNVEAANFKGTADRVQNSLQINGKTYDGSSAISVGTIEVAYGGTGYSSIKDTTYTTARYRASALRSTEAAPTINGTINWVYE